MIMKNLTEIKGNVFEEYINPILGYELLMSYDYGKFTTLVASAFILTPMQWLEIKRTFNKYSVCLN